MILHRSLSIFTTFVLAVSASLPAAIRAADNPVYELRIYTTNEGKLPDLLKRFREHTCKLFEKHGITNVGYWVPLDKPDGAENTLIYVISHPNRDAAKENWGAFSKDPEWQAAAKASEINGKILAKKPESVYMTMTEFSPALKPDAGGGSRVFELRTYRTPEGKLADLHARFKNHTITLFAKHGMHNIAYWTPTDADKGSANTLIYLLAHPSREAASKAFADFRNDSEWVKAKTASEKNGPLTLPGKDGVKSIYMSATDFSPLR